MIKQHLKSFFVLFIITVIISTSFVNAQSTLICPYTFTKDLESGSTGEEVRLLQKILNTDKRTLIALDGPGSQGNETTAFSEGTVVSLKKFQALYPDFIGLVDGKLGSRTRTVINAICNRSMNSTPTKDLRISLSANLNAVQMGNSFKVIINSSSELQKFAAENLIIDGGEIKEIRKLSKTSYVAMVISLEGFKKVSIQVEAEGLMSIDGIKNENASNEILVKIIIPAPVATTSTVSTTINTDTDSFTALLNKIVSSVPNCTYNSSGQLITGEKLNTAGCATTNASTNNQNSQVQYKDCYGQQIPSTQQCPYDPYRAQQQYQQQQYQQQLAQQQAQQRYQQGLSGFGGSGAGGFGGAGGAGGLSGMLENLLKGKGFGGNGNTNNNSTSANNTQSSVQPTETAEQKAAREKKEAEDKTAADAKIKADADAKAKLDACADQACKDKLKQEEEARIAKEKADAEKAKTQNKDLSVVVKKLENCAAGRPYFCSNVTSKPEAGENGYFPSFDPNKISGYTFKKGGKTFAIIGDKGKIDLRKDECIVQDPEIARNFYDQQATLVFAGCSKEIGQKFMGQGHLYCSEKPNTTGLVDPIGIRVYTYTGAQVLKSAPCNK